MLDNLNSIVGLSFLLFPAFLVCISVAVFFPAFLLFGFSVKFLVSSINYGRKEVFFNDRSAHFSG